MWNPFTRESRVLVSSLSVEACRERLRADVGSLWNPFTAWNHPVRGRVTGKGFWIVKTIHYRNSFQTEARGRWTAEGNGTRIDVSFGMSRWIAGFMIVWLIGIAAFVVGWWGSGPAGSAKAAGAGTLLVFLPLLMLGFGIGLIAFGRWLARNESRELIEFLTRTLECQPDAAPIF